MSKDHTQQRPRIVLFQPDIPGNTGTILRLAACLNFAVDIIEPAGFRLDNKSLLRSGMDYLELAQLKRHDDWTSFETWRRERQSRLILMTTKSEKSHFDFQFQPSDCLIFGRESAGAPDFVHKAADSSLTIPMPGKGRSLNLAVSVSIVAGEVLRQLN